MENKFNVDYWIEVWNFRHGNIKFKIHLDDQWQPAVFEDCVVVIVRNEKWWVGFKMYKFKQTCALRNVRIFANQHMTPDHEITEYISYGGWNE